MSLKKYLKRYNKVLHGAFGLSKKGQAASEYFILLTVVAALTIVGMAPFFERIQDSTERYSNFAVNQMVPVLPAMSTP